MDLWHKTRETVKFTDIFNTKEKIIVVLPADLKKLFEDLKQASRLFTKFKKAKIILEPDYFAFFQKHLVLDNLTLEKIPPNRHIFSDPKVPTEKTMILNLSDDPVVSKKMSNLKTAAISSLNGYSNLKIKPVPYNSKNLIDNLLQIFSIKEDFTNLPNTDLIINESVKKEKKRSLKSYYPEFNNGNNIVFNLTSKKNMGEVKSHFTKLEYRKNFFLVFLNCKIKLKNEYIDNFKIKEKDLLQIFKIVLNTDMFIVDDFEYFQILNRFFDNCYMLRGMSANSTPNQDTRMISLNDLNKINRMKE